MTIALGYQLRRLRQRAGLSATALAGDALSVATISRIEHGTVEPSLATLRYLAEQLGCPVAELLADDDDEARAVAALEEVEAWLLFAMPQAALDRAVAALAAGAATPVPAVGAATGRRLRWAVARAEALLNPMVALALDTAIGEARRGGDVWSGARLVTVRATTLEVEVALPLLEAALRGLPPSDGDTPAQQLTRAELSRLLAQQFEGAGELETARGLASAATSLSELFRQPLALAQRLNRPPEIQRCVVRRGAQRPPALAGPRPEVTPAFALALLAAGSRLWRAATLDLARLDLQSHRLADAARRLRSIYGNGTAGGASTELAVLGGFWNELDRTLDLGSRAPGAWLPSRLTQHSPSEVPPPAADELVQVEMAIHAGRPADAERSGAVLAVALATTAPALATAIWLRLALAWADAGNAPRTARALRAATQTG
ncbi:MAG: helix-turn-helix domain-containing protein [Chloroflexota bacterium]